MAVNERFEISIVDREAVHSMEFAHSHSFYELFLLIEGECEMLVGDSTHLLTSNSLYFIPTNTPHQTHYATGVTSKRLNIEFAEKYLRRLYQAFGAKTIEDKIMNKVIQLPEFVTERIVAISEELISESKNKDEYTKFSMDIHFEHLIIYILRHHTAYYNTLYSSIKITDQDLRNALSYINNNYNQKITLPEVASLVHLNPCYFSQKFKTLTGRGFKEYLTSIRITQSEKLLLETNLSMSEIAYKCGFESSNYYGDAFKKIYNISPTAFRQKKGLI